MSRRIEESVLVAAPPEEVFDLVHDYDRRLEWDPFLRRAEIESGADRAAVGVSTYCAAHWRNGGFGMRTVYISFQRPTVAAVEMTQGPWCLDRFVASITQRPAADASTRVSYKFRFEVWPRWAAGLLEPWFARRFRAETRRRLRHLADHFGTDRDAARADPTLEDV